MILNSWTNTTSYYSCSSMANVTPVFLQNRQKEHGSFHKVQRFIWKVHSFILQLLLSVSDTFLGTEDPSVTSQKVYLLSCSSYFYRRKEQANVVISWKIGSMIIRKIIVIIAC